MKQTSRRFPLMIAVLAFALLGAGTIAIMTLAGPPATKPSLIGGPFTLTEDDGHTVTDANFRGHPFLVFFGYTHCPDVCPTTLYELTQVLKAMGPQTQVKVLFVTVDPARDTAKVMKKYLTSFDPHIIGLFGNAAQTQAIEHGYRAYAKKVPEKNGDYTMDHTAIVYLMDRDGHFVAPFDLGRKPQVAAAELDKYL